MPYRKTNIKRKKPGEYVPWKSKTDKYSYAIMKKLDKACEEAIMLDDLKELKK